jgi:hypothetical protein
MNVNRKQIFSGSYLCEEGQPYLQILVHRYLVRGQKRFGEGKRKFDNLDTGLPSIISLESPEKNGFSK